MSNQNNNQNKSAHQAQPQGGQRQGNQHPHGNNQRPGSQHQDTQRPGSQRPSRDERR